MKVEQKLSIIFLNIGPVNKGNKMPQLSPYPYKLGLGSPGGGGEKAADIPDTAAAADTCPGHAARAEGGAAWVYISYHSYQWPGPYQLGGRRHARRQHRDICVVVVIDDTLRSANALRAYASSSRPVIG